MRVESLKITREELDMALQMYLNDRGKTIGVEFGSVYLENFDDDGDIFIIKCNQGEGEQDL